MARSGIATAGDVTALSEALREIFSAEILHEALGVMRYDEFAVHKTELLAVAGQTVNITKYLNRTRGGELTESVDMVTDTMAASQISVTVKEYGKAFALTERLLRLSWDELMEEMAFQLGRDFARVRDLALRDVLVAGGNVLFTNPTASGVGDVTASDLFDVETIRIAVEELQTKNAPKFLNDFYVCFAHPHQISYLKRDPDWINAHNYHRTRAPFVGEAGRWEDVVFIQTTNQGNGAVVNTEDGYEASLDGTGSGGINLYRATMLADQSYAVVDALTVELRDDGVNDFGRTHKLAWYAIWGQAILEDDFVQHIVSG